MEPTLATRTPVLGFAASTIWPLPALRVGHGRPLLCLQRREQLVGLGGLGLDPLLVLADLRELAGHRLPV